MIGSIIGAGLKIGGSIFGGITMSKAIKEAKAGIEQQKQKNQNWFDQRYNEDATQRADAQALLARTEENIKNRNLAAAGSQAVMGGTDATGSAEGEAETKNGSDGLRNNGRGRVEGRTDQRQGDLAKTGNVADNGVSEWYQNLRLSGELDQNNSPFILSPNGQIDFGQITEAHHLPAAPIRLSMGDMTNDYIHINRRHGKQIQKAGFDSIEAFVDYVVNNFTRIKEGASYENASGGKNNTYLIQLQDGHNNTLFVQLSRDGKYWNVNSAGVFGKKYGDKEEEIWSASEVQNDNSAVASDGLQSEPIADNGSTSNGTPSKNEEYNRHATAKQPVETVETSQDAEQGDTQTSSSMNVPTSSVGKVSNTSSDVQEKGKKSSAEKKREAAIADAWVKVKEKNPDRIALVRIGDSYVAYGADASVCADVLNIGTKGVADSRLGRKAEFPHEALDIYLPKLISDGHKVAIFDNLNGGNTVPTESVTPKAEAERPSADSTQMPTFLDVVSTLYNKGKEYASKIFSRSFFDVASTPDFMKEYGLTGSKFTIQYGVLARHFGKDAQHNLPLNIWESLPEALRNPLYITKYFVDEEKKVQKGYRLYTSLRLDDGTFVMVSAEVVNAGRDIEINKINTVFGKGSISKVHDEIIYKNPKTTPEQEALLGGTNPHQYPTERELSGGKVTKKNGAKQEKAEKSAAEPIEDVGEKIGGAKYGDIVSVYARQGVLFADPDQIKTVADFRNATMMMLADALNDKRVTLLKTTLQLYNNEARQSASGQADLFSGGVRSREDILRDVVNYIKENYGKRKEIEAARAAAVERRKAESVQQDGTDATGSAEGEAETKNGSDGLRNNGRGRVEGHSDQRQGDLAETGDISVVSSSERAEMENRITDWLSEENLERAKGKTREEIFEEFGNELAPIAYLPTKHLSLLGDNVKDPRIYCGKGYFIDHALRNHGDQGTQIDIDDVDVSKYLNIQYVLDNPDHIKETFTDGKRTVVFIKKIGRYFAELTQLEENGRIVLHKSLFNQKKEPYVKLPDIRQKGASSEGGASSISHADNAAPAISLESRGDAISSESQMAGVPVTTSIGSLQGKEGNTLQTAAFQPHGGVSSVGKVSNTSSDVQEKGKKSSAEKKREAAIATYEKMLDDLWSNEKSSWFASEIIVDAERKLAREEFDKLNVKENKTEGEAKRLSQAQTLLNTSREEQIEKRFAEHWKKRFGETEAAAERQFNAIVEACNNAGSIADVLKAYGDLYGLCVRLYQNHGKRGGHNINARVGYLDAWKKPFREYLEGLTDDQLVGEVVDAIPSFGKRTPLSEGSELAKVVNDVARKRGKERIEAAQARIKENAVPRPIGRGAFGNIYDAFKGKAKEAVDFLRKKKDGEALGALHHKDIGDIDLVWGEEGSGKSDGFGLAKLVKYHPEVLDNLQEIIDDMKVTSRSENRVQLESKTHQAAVRLTWDNEKKNWLLTAFEKKNSASDNTTDTDETLSGKGNDTATPQNTVSSGGKVTKKNGAKQEKAEKNVDEKPRLQKVSDEAKRLDDEYLGADGAEPLSHGEAVLREAVVEQMRRNGMDVIDDVAEGQRVLDAANEEAKLEAKRKRALETVSVSRDEEHQQTVISSADGAKVLNNLDMLVKEYENSSQTKEKTFIGVVAEALGAERDGSKSEYATFETKNGKIVTIRLADHNAEVSTFDNHDELDGISIVVSAKENKGIDNDGSAHVTEFFYDAIKLRRAEGKPLAEIVKSIKQALYSGEFKDNTGLAERQEVNAGYSAPKYHSARHHSEKAERRARVNATIDAANAFVSGRTVAEARKARRAREAAYKAETKELYGKVLSGEFDTVTLQRINDYLDHATPLNEYGRPLSKRLPSKALRRVRKGERTSEVDALFSRICESAVGKNERTRPEGKRRIEEKKRELLKAWAIASGNWHTSVADFTGNTEPIGRGKDSVVYMSDDGKSVIKVSAGKDNLKKYRPDVDAVPLFNYVFPESRYEILGYGEVDGKFVKFLKQPFVDFTDSTPLSAEERVAYMESMGFEPRNEEQTVFSNGEIIIADLQGNNIVKDKAGNIRVIDADVKLHTKDIGGKWEYPAVEDDTTMPEAAVEDEDEAAADSDKPRFFRTADGEAYGFTVGGKIYYDPKIATSETPVHEYGHLWAEALRVCNPKEWKNVVELMKGTPVWEEVKRTYPGLKTDDEIADEVIAQYSGRRGAARLRAEAKKIAEGNGGVFEKAEAISALQRMKQALEKFWHSVCDFLHIHYKSAEEVADRVMKDLLDGVDPRAAMKEGKARQAEAEAEEIVAKAKADGTYMKAPNGARTNLNEKRWAQVRTSFFKKWFGDWEKAAIWRRVKALVPKDIEKREVSAGEASAAYDAIKFATNRSDNKRVEFVKTALGKIIRHKGFDTKQIVSDLKELFETSVPISFEEEVAKEGHKDHSSNFVGYHHYLNKFSVDGKEYYIRFTAQEIKTNPSRKKEEGFTPYQFHNTSISDVAIYESTDSSVESPGTFPVTGTNRAYFDAKLQQFIEEAKKAEENSSKIVDENGEPRVVYHQTNSTLWVNRVTGENFDELDWNERSYWQNEASEEEWVENWEEQDFYTFDNKNHGRRSVEMPAYFFAPEYDEHHEYGDRTVAAFLNIKNPAVNPTIENRGVYDDAGEKAMQKLIDAGYDGFIREYDGEVNETNAFYPNQIKSATENIGTFDEDDNDIRYHISRRNGEAIDRMLDKGGLFDERAKAAFHSYVEHDEPSAQLAMAKWAGNGSIRLPEDRPTVDEALKICRKDKLDPMHYGSPGEIVKEWRDSHVDAEQEEKRELLSPDAKRYNDVLTNKREYEGGITVYDVADTKEGQQAVRDLMNDHLTVDGKHYNCWCLEYASESTGELSPNSCPLNNW